MLWQTQMHLKKFKNYLSSNGRLSFKFSLNSYTFPLKENFLNFNSFLVSVPVLSQKILFKSEKSTSNSKFLTSQPC